MVKIYYCLLYGLYVESTIDNYLTLSTFYLLICSCTYYEYVCKMNIFGMNEHNCNLLSSRWYISTYMPRRCPLLSKVERIREPSFSPKEPFLHRHLLSLGFSLELTEGSSCHAQVLPI